MSSMASPRPAVVGALVWLALATAVGATGVMGALRAGPQLVALTLSIAAVLISSRVAVIRRSVDAIPMRTLVGIHATRFIGIAFLILGARGLLSPLFAERAGWGDTVTAAIAVVLLIGGIANAGAVGRRVLLVWNAFGLLDLIVAVGTAALVIGRGDLPGMAPLLTLPLVLVPIFAVPVLMATHVAIFRRLRASSS